MKDASMTTPDYSLTGPSAQRALEAGLVAAEWYHSDVPRKRMKALMKRRDGPAVRDTVLWALFHVIFAAGGIYFWGTWIAVPFWLAYGVIYGSACDSRWHECGHGTAFRTRWLNDVVYHIASFQVMRNPVSWRWSHARHHTDTLIVGRDPEIAVMHPISLALLAARFFDVLGTWASLRDLAAHAAGRLSDDLKTYIPEKEWPKAVLCARIHMAIYFAVAVVTLYMMLMGFGWRSAIPVLLIGGPRIYGSWHMVMTGLLQHGGLPENVIDHRLNSRTVLMNPISRFIYLNMNYHVEHHMFPMVPYYGLPALHEEIRHDLPEANRSISQAYREMVGAMIRQQRDPEYVLRKDLPGGAKPYREELHQTVP